MSIEVRQFEVKSNVGKKDDNEAEEKIMNNSCTDIEEIKTDILNQCKELIVKMLNERQER